MEEEDDDDDPFDICIAIYGIHFLKPVTTKLDHPKVKKDSQ